MKKKEKEKLKRISITERCFKFEIVALVMQNKVKAKYVDNVLNKNNIFG